MRRFLVRWLLTALALYAAVQLVPGISYDGNWTTLAGMALVFGLVNALVRPLLTLLSCPLILLTLGLFTLVINGALLLLAAHLADLFGVRFYVQGFSAAFWGALVISIVSFLVSLFIREEHRRRR
jgi:putative membrane protein